MRPWLLHVLRCPECGATPLELDIDTWREAEFGPSPLAERPCHLHGEADCAGCASGTIESGTLRCSCGSTYPIEGFVPNLAGDLADEFQEDAAETYAYLWENFDVERVAGEDDVQKLVTFEEKTGIDPARLDGKLVLDAGCGPGQLIRLLGVGGAHAVDCDLVVPSVLRSLERERLFDFVQADMLRMPFARGSFDLVYSIGVIHHIPDSETVFRELAATTADDGDFSAWVYGGKGAAFVLCDNAMRAVTTRLPHGVVKGISVLTSPLFPLARRVLGGEKAPILRKDSEHLIYDWLRTPYRRFYRESELADLLGDMGWRVGYRSPHPLGLTFRKEGADAVSDAPAG